MFGCVCRRSRHGQCSRGKSWKRLLHGKIRGACRPAGVISDILAAATRLSRTRQSCQSPARTLNAPLDARPRNTHALAGKSLYMPWLNTRRCQFLTWRPHHLPLSPPYWDERANVCSRRASISKLKTLVHVMWWVLNKCNKIKASNLLMWRIRFCLTLWPPHQGDV